MSLWEYLGVQNGWHKSRQSEAGGGSGEARPPTTSEYEAALERFGVKPSSD